MQFTKCRKDISRFVKKREGSPGHLQEHTDKLQTLNGIHWCHRDPHLSRETPQTTLTLLGEDRQGDFLIFHLYTLL